MVEAIHTSGTLPRMRGIKQAIAELKQTDPGTALTEKALRRLVLTKAIPSVRVGTKYLINLDTLYDYLYRGGDTEETAAPVGVIRKIAE